MAFFIRFWAVLLLCSTLTGTAGAQDTNTAEFDRWSRLATFGESTIDGGGGSEAGLENLRTRIVEFRSQFDMIRSQNGNRIRALREQLAALGTAPEGETAAPEAAEVVAKRAELTEQLNAFLEPVQRAEAEFVRADALISQIDHILRERQTELLLTLTPSPLNPVHWQPAVTDIQGAVQSLWRETAPQTQRNFWETTPVVLALTLLGLVLIFRGRRWSIMIVESLQRVGARGFGIWRFLVSLLRIALPFAGLIVLSQALISTELFSDKADDVIRTIAGLGGMILVIRWISERVFARDDDEALILLPVHQRSRMRFNVWIITVTSTAAELISQILATRNPSEASEPVLVFVPLVISCLALFRMGVILRSYSDERILDETSEELRVTTLSRVVRGLGTGAVAVGCLAPLLLAAGYFKAANALLPPYVLTLALLGFVMVLQRFLADIYGAVTGQGPAARDTLMPVIFGLVLLVIAAPFVALIWGARFTDLTELWAAFGRGFSIGESRISPSDFVVFAVIFGIGYVLTRLMQSALKTNVLPKTKIDIGGQNAIVSGLGYFGIFLAALLAITGAGIDLSSLAIVAGALSVGIGFGLQNIVSNFVSGIILLIERPISEGDWIEVGGNMGYVRGISVRSTRIETFDRTDVIVPNADLVSGTVTNYTRGNTVGRVIIAVGVAYGTDTRRVEAILTEIAEAQPMVLSVPPPAVLFVNFGADSLEFEVRCVLRDVNWMMVVKNDINHAIAARFVEEGIEIPFAQRDLWLRNPESLRAPAAAPLTGDAD
jgi:potassium efflux system protein